MELYRKWAAAFRSSHSSIYNLCAVLPYTTVSQRKILLLQARCQILPRDTTWLYRRNVQLWKSNIDYIDRHGKSHSTDLLAIGMQLEGYLSPITSGLVSVIVRTAPYEDYTSIHEEFTGGRAKEINAAINPQSCAQLDYRSILSFERDVRSSTRLYTNLPLDAALHDDIFLRFVRARTLLSNTTIFPKTNNRYVGVEGRRNMKLYAKYGFFTMGMDTGDDGGSTREAERLYSRTGWNLMGNVEAGMSWKYAHLKPRLFYRIGLTQFQNAKYIQQIFTVIIDQFPNVHTFLRHNASSLSTEGFHEFIAFIYDYSAFTSSLEDLSRFIDALATFFRGTIITVIDSFAGPVQVDLGDLLDEYNRSANFQQEFDASEIYDVAELILRHTTGMLGIPGNISACTLLHGIHLTIVLGSFLANKVVGDDAIGYILMDLIPRNTIPILQDRIDNLGSVSLMKGATWKENCDQEDYDDVTWNYVKRPVYRFGNRMMFGEMVTWPDPIFAFGQNDDIHSCDPNLFRPETRAMSFCKRLCRFYEVLEGYTLNDHELSLIRTFNRTSFRCISVDMNEFGSSVAEVGYRNPGVRYHENWKESYVEQHYWSVEKLQDTESVCCIPRGFQTIDGDPFVSTSYPILRWCCQMGYMNKEMRSREVIIGEVDGYDKYMVPNRDMRYRYDYTTIAEIPEWAVSMIQDLPIYVHDEQYVSNTDDDYDMDWMYRDTDTDCSDSSDED